MEKKVQDKLIRFLKKHGCYVIKITVVPGVPTGTPDVFFCKEGFYGFAECKANSKSKFQPLQRERIAMFHEWSWCRVVHSGNIDEIILQLEKLL
jgi:Holliday junction resolvase